VIDLRDLVFFLSVIGFALFATRHHHSRTFAPDEKYEHLIYSAVGLAALLLLLVAFNYLASTTSVRVDLTDRQALHLSDGTPKILKRLSSPVKVKLYLSQGEAVPVPLRSFAQRVEDLVREFERASNNNLKVERYNPRPDFEGGEGGTRRSSTASSRSSSRSGESSTSARRSASSTASRRSRRSRRSRAPARVRPGARHRARRLGRAAKVGLMSGLPVLGESSIPSRGRAPSRGCCERAEARVA